MTASATGSGVQNHPFRRGTDRQPTISLALRGGAMRAKHIEGS
jgi:hypothetical protein